MKSYLYAGVALLALCGSAAAADLTTPPPIAPAPIVAPAFNWTGFYVGVHGGGGFGSFDLDTYPDAFGNGDGALLGSQIGYNYQVNQWVFGIQTDMAYTWMKSSSAYNLADAKVDWLGTTTGRVGYAADTWLFYAKGGVAYGDTHISSSVYSESQWKAGWTVGAGVEKAFTPNITGFAEYDYVDLGSTQYGNVGRLSFDTNIVKVGLNYKF
jgi:outer membrane immunogenic protein